jgi:hypothetical protein
MLDFTTRTPLAGINELAAGLFWREEAKVLAIWGYFDESGEHDPKTGRLVNMSIGGVYSSKGRREALEDGWRRVLAREGLKEFHMKDFEAWKPPFDFKLADGGRDKDGHNRILTTCSALWSSISTAFTDSAPCRSSTRTGHTRLRTVGS